MSRKSVKRATIASGVALVIGSLVAGCTGGAPAPAPAASGATEEGGGSLTIWSQWVEGQPGATFLSDMAKEFESETGTEVTIVFKGNPVAQSLVPTLNSPNVPTDLVETSADQILNLLNPTGGILDLSEVYKEEVPGVGKTIAEVEGESLTALASPVGDDGRPNGNPVVAPYWVNAQAVVFFNGENFPELIDAPPQTWSEFKAILDEQKDAGRQPIAVDCASANYCSWPFKNALYSYAGEDAFVKAALDPTGETWGEPEYLEAANFVDEIVEAGYLLDGYSDSKFPAMATAWANNDSDFSLNGSWAPAEAESFAAPGFDFRSFPFPAMDGHDMPPLTGGGSGFAILKNAANQDNAKAFIAFMLTKEVQDRVSTDMGQIPVLEGSPVSEAVQPLKDQFDAGNVLSVQNTPAMGDYNAKVFFPASNDLMFGRITPEEFIDTLKTESKSYWDIQG